MHKFGSLSINCTFGKLFVNTPLTKVYIQDKTIIMKRKLIFLFILFSTTIILAQKKDTIRIAAVGDIMMGTAFPSEKYLPPKGKNPFEGVLDELQSADLLFGNLEGCISDTGKNAKHCKDPDKCYSFRMPSYLAEYLNTAGFDLVSIANNHIGDFGRTGIENTKKNLDRYQIKYAGVYGNETAVFEKDSITYGFCAFAPNRDTVKLTDIDNAVEIVKSLAEQADIVIVSFHGGAEGDKHTHVTRKTETFYGENRGNVYAFAHAVIDAGADIVLGHGPHVPRAIEIYKDKFIAYSLGNFCTYGRFSLSGSKGYAPIVKISVDSQGNFIEGKVVSARQTKTECPHIDANASAFKMIRTLTGQDFPEVPVVFEENGRFYLKK